MVLGASILCSTGFMLYGTSSEALTAGLDYQVASFKVSAFEQPIEPVPSVPQKSERTQIVDYLQEKFGDASVEAITIIRACENGTFDPKRVSPLNIQKSGRRSYDVGLMQINVDENNTAEQERLKDWKYNIDRGYAKYKASGNKFTQWTCAKVIGQKNYLGE
jgi:hypothetical protein